MQTINILCSFVVMKTTSALGLFKKYTFNMMAISFAHGGSSLSRISTKSNCQMLSRTKWHVWVGTVGHNGQNMSVFVFCQALTHDKGAIFWFWVPICTNVSQNQSCGAAFCCPSAMLSSQCRSKYPGITAIPLPALTAQAIGEVISAVGVTGQIHKA